MDMNCVLYVWERCIHVQSSRWLDGCTATSAQWESSIPDWLSSQSLASGSDKIYKKDLLLHSSNPYIRWVIRTYKSCQGPTKSELVLPETRDYIWSLRWAISLCLHGSFDFELFDNGGAVWAVLWEDTLGMEFSKLSLPRDILITEGSCFTTLWAKRMQRPVSLQHYSSHAGLPVRPAQRPRLEWGFIPRGGLRTANYHIFALRATKQAARSFAPEFLNLKMSGQYRKKRFVKDSC